MKRLLATLLVSSGFIAPTLGFEVKLYLTGTEFEGMPAFEVKFGDTILDTATLSKVVPEGEEFTFDIPEEYADDTLRVRMTNDKYEQDVGDRNLQLVEAVVGGKEFLPADFTYEQDGKPIKNTNGRLNRNTVVAVAEAPEGGWGSSTNKLAAAVTAPEIEDPAPTISEPKNEAPTPAASEPEAATPSPVETVEAAEAQTEVACEPSSLVIAGFRNGALELSEEQKAQIDAFDVADNCSLSATGYSSTSGSAAANQRISEARAKVVADYLAAVVGTDAKVTVVGAGETEQFGSDQASNRRVVIEAKPVGP